MNESPDVRIGDVEREQAMQALGEHMSAGRLDVNEYGDRATKVAAARTGRELLALFDDLPQPHPAFAAPAAPPAPVKRKPTPGEPVSWLDRPVGQRVFAAVIPLLFVGAIVLGLSIHIWWFLAVPIIAGAIGRGFWGPDWDADRHGNRHGSRHDRHRERRRDWEDRRRELGER